MYQPRQAARSMIERAAAMGLRVSNLTLQKLLYIAHGAHLATSGRPLVNDDFVAWRYGPVLEELYHDLKVYGSDEIHATDRYIQQWPRIPEDDAGIEAVAIIDSVLAHFGNWSGGSLIKWSHQEGAPWARAYAATGTANIPDEDIQKYFAEHVIKHA